jgi:hypothetical protein
VPACSTLPILSSFCGGYKRSESPSINSTEFISVVSVLARHSSGNYERLLRSFFERLIPYMFRPKSVMQYHEWYWDNFKFIIHEMFLYAIGFLLKQGAVRFCFAANVAWLLRRRCRGRFSRTNAAIRHSGNIWSRSSIETNNLIACLSVRTC